LLDSRPVPTHSVVPPEFTNWRDDSGLAKHVRPFGHVVSMTDLYLKGRIHGAVVERWM